MTNKYPGKCRYCGGNVPAGTGKVEKVNGSWLVSHVGGCPEITSGLGISGVGSDDHNLHTEPRGRYQESARAGEQYAPTGTTYGTRTPGKKCHYCGAPANWNPGAGMYLCNDHWDEY
jgi:ribosomal protein L24E